MGLDVLTSKGRANEVHNDRCMEIVKGYFDFLNLTLQKLPTAHTADGLFRCNQRPFILLEVKSRHNFTEHFFRTQYGEKWLVTDKKIRANITMASRHNIPFLGAMNIVDSRVVLLKTIFDREIAPGIDVRFTKTQATINGGEIFRDNAYIPMHDAIRIVY